MNATMNPLVSQLLGVDSKPCLSLYLATHRTQPERRDDPTHFRVLVRTLAESLEKDHTSTQITSIMEPFNALVDDEAFWNQRKEGIAMFRTPEMFVTHHLDRPVPDLAIVAHSFHLKPLLRLLETTDRYHVLTLTSERVRLYVGDRDGLSEVHLGPDVPLTINKVLGSELSERHFTRSNSGNTPRSIPHSTIHDEEEIDLERFFRIVDRSITQHASHPSGLPLILVGLPEQVSTFMRVKHNPNVLLESVATFPESLDMKELVERSWSIMEPYIQRQSMNLIANYHEHAAHARGLEHINDIAAAAFAGRIDTLMVDANRQVAGALDLTRECAVYNDAAQPAISDVLDELALLVMRKGGKVLVLSTEHMPTTSPAAAILRY
ncbi:hypothetical protein BH10BAC6_BH10BAC6_05740 [soil metagenome]